MSGPSVATALPPIAPRVRAGRRLALARACGVAGRARRTDAAEAPRLRVHDALAGWGTDGLVLASLGCAVHMSERHPAVYERLLERIREYDAVGPAASGRRSSLCGPVTAALEDARERWRRGPAFDVVYLDPMFGPHPKGAAPSGPMQALAALAPPPADVEELVELARRAARDRVVVKQRRSAAACGAPAWQIAAKTVRFDVYRPPVSRRQAPGAAPRK